MGRCSINLVDGQSAMHNPGTVALEHFDKFVAFSLPRRNAFLNLPIAMMTHLESSNFSVGISSEALHLDTGRRLSFAAALSYASIDYSFGPFYVTTYENSPFPGGIMDIHQYIDSYTASIAAQYLVRVGVGYSYKKVKYNSFFADLPFGFSSQSYVHDIGAIIEIPVMDIINELTDGSAYEQSAGRLELTPSVTYFETRHSRIGTRGLGFHGALRESDVTMGSITVVWERDSRQRYIDGESERIGAEAGLFDILFVRLGQYRMNSPSSANTYGFGFSLHGMLAWMMHLNWITPDNPTLERFLRSIDVTADFATSDGFDTYDNPQFFKIGFSF